ncbi:MAG: CHAP domain-containing protein [Acetobacteraceae bacterium]|nr:CHAP domain-containing protein [Acetobacteraceae bacterium]
MLARRAALILPLLAAACARGPRVHETATFAPPAPLSCVPFARELSGVRLAGDAHTWWQAAAGHYARANRPVPGAVLVFRSTRRLPDGHLAVVVRERGPREILASHANWGAGSERGQVHQNQPIVDVSARNDWTLVRVWHPPTDRLGATAFPTWGFILPPVRRNPEEIAAEVPRAARAAGASA